MNKVEFLNDKMQEKEYANADFQSEASARAFITDVLNADIDDDQRPDRDDTVGCKCGEGSAVYYHFHDLTKSQNEERHAMTYCEKCGIADE